MGISMEVLVVVAVRVSIDAQVCWIKKRCPDLKNCEDLGNDVFARITLITCMALQVDSCPMLSPMQIITQTVICGEVGFAAAELRDYNYIIGTEYLDRVKKMIDTLAYLHTACSWPRRSSRITLLVDSPFWSAASGDSTNDIPSAVGLPVHMYWSNSLVLQFIGMPRKSMNIYGYICFEQRRGVIFHTLRT
jgi:hypothetical protein